MTNDEYPPMNPQNWLQRNIGYIGWALFILAAGGGIVGILAWESHNEKACAQRKCDNGGSPGIVRYQGCVCIVRPEPAQ